MNTEPTTTLPLADLATVEELARENAAILTVPTLRWQLRHRDTNGLAPACVRLGKKLLIYRTRYAAWAAARAGA